MCISVCMATYNGASFIEQQLRSVLSQLAVSDEVVIVDDNSSDTTLGVIGNCGDPRVKIYSNESNQGAIRTFERAIGLASGHIIFLCDQDDIWQLEKVERIISIFTRYPEVTLVLSDAKIIDAKGEICGSFFERRGRFVPGLLHNIIKNKYIGCAMAFRRSLVSKILPFPDSLPMHDVWIGCINAIFGKTYFINAPLFYYRRHCLNASPLKRRAIVRIVVSRLMLVICLCVRVLHLRREST